MAKPRRKSIHTSFDEGKTGEDIVKKILVASGLDCEKSDGGISHDLWIKNINQHIEVKYDIMSAKTGNMALEYHNSKKNKPSGIYATTAKYWAHIVFRNNERMVYVGIVEDIKDYIANTKPKKHIIGGGDDNADLFIYDMDVIFEEPDLFIRLDTADDETIERIFSEL